MDSKSKTTYSASIEVAGQVYEKTVDSVSSINQLMEGLVYYIKQEGINQLGECSVKVRQK